MERDVGDKFLFEDEPLVFHLIRAENHLSLALDLIYGKGVLPAAYHRRLLWRMSLMRAQSITMKLLVRELSKVKNAAEES
jgi:hypothetical protein